MMQDLFSKITNDLFYVKKEKEGLIKTFADESVLYKTNYDNKVILILHNLYIGTNFNRECLITLDYLINKCNYKTVKENRKSFKLLLEKLRELELISFENINKSNELIILNTEKLMLNQGDYTILTQYEIDVLSNVKDTRLMSTLLKLYLYLKVRVTKRKEGEDINMYTTPQTTYQSYEFINKYTKISESRIKEYIDKLQDLGLIKYRNIGKRYKINDKYKKLTECPNVYALTILQDDIDSELDLGIKQCKKKQQEDGYIVVDNNYKNNNRKTNGKKGALIKKQNNGTITESEKVELEELKL
ncbi:hypothetical protein [Clostridium sp. M14]|uniref:hypothetical protein n=1 Tax=Clostridium sp. M14 TaxID=2716311 RepID=UPI0013EEE183|nr:hypothetical protein [Clostridium sp. M14]MBZ9693401.1 hypothetical protein [Clostridium sp. M14]